MIHLNTAIPLTTVFLDQIQIDVCFWQKLNYKTKAGLDDKADEAFLALCNVGGAPVHELGHIEVVKLFLVSLFKELREKQVRPLFRQVEWFGHVGNIAQVENFFTDKLFVFEIGGIHIFVFYLSFEDSYLAEVHGHVCCQYSSDNLLPDPLVVICTKFLKDVVSFILDDLEGGGGVEVLEHADVVVLGGDVVALLNQIQIVEARVSYVVAGPRQNVAHHVPIIHAALLFQPAVDRDVVKSLGQVCGVRFVVVGNVKIHALHLLDERQELFVEDG